jgi:hypothetical protein
MCETILLPAPALVPVCLQGHLPSLSILTLHAYDKQQQPSSLLPFRLTHMYSRILQLAAPKNTLHVFLSLCTLGLKCDGTRAETRFLLSAKRMSPFKSAGVSVQSTTGSQDVRISGSNAGYTMFRGSVKSTG